MADLAPRLLPWFQRHGRRDLPWQQDPTPYRVWVSEIMLQQTRVSTVIPYFNRFLECFPSIDDLAAAPLDRVLHLWSGLGYYARARNLHRTARIVVRDFGGNLPMDPAELMKLPGIGRSTAGAVPALSLGRRCAILDGNVKRVLTRFYGISGWPGRTSVANRLWRLAARETPRRRAAAYTQALMDLGATVCVRSRPDCAACPLAAGCLAFKHGEQCLLPTPRTRKPLPRRGVVFALLENERGEVLLEKRPPAGVWGGLWSFPEHEPGTPLSAWVKSRYALVVEELETLPQIRHVFSHFQLDVTPVRGIVRGRGGAVQDSDTLLWRPPGRPPAIGLPAPVKKLLQALCAGKSA